jgi:hypothetical protein
LGRDISGRVNIREDNRGRMKRGLKEKGINRERDTRKRDKSGEG